jgi:hypothetical protein
MDIDNFLIIALFNLIIENAAFVKSSKNTTEKILIIILFFVRLLDGR